MKLFSAINREPRNAMLYKKTIITMPTISSVHQMYTFGKVAINFHMQKLYLLKYI